MSTLAAQWPDEDRHVKGGMVEEKAEIANTGSEPPPSLTGRAHGLHPKGHGPCAVTLCHGILRSLSSAEKFGAAYKSRMPGE